MSKYNEQKITDELGANLFAQSLDPNFFSRDHYSDRVMSDNVSDVDGTIRLRDGSSHYLNLYLFYQLKSTNSSKGARFSCSGEIIDFLVSVNTPIILILSNIKDKKVYWMAIGKTEKEKYKLKASGNKGATFDLSENLLSLDNSLQINTLWQKIAKKENQEELDATVVEISNSFQQDITRSLGLLYLLQTVNKGELPNIFLKILKIDINEINIIIKKLLSGGVINKTVNYYILSNEKIGIQSLHQLLSELDLVSLEKIFSDPKDRKLILEQLAKIEHKVARDYLIKIANQLLAFSKKSTNNDNLFTHLELLQEYFFRVSDIALSIVKTVISSKPVPPIITKYEGFGDIEGKTYKDIIIQCIKILDNLMYLNDDVFEILANLSLSEDKNIGQEALRILEKLSKYNLYVLKKVGYQSQLNILNKIEKWNDVELLERVDIVVCVCKEMLEPIFEGMSRDDYKTFTLHSGALNVSDNLKSIRKRSLEMLKKLYFASDNVKDKSKILAAMQEATIPPRSVIYGDDTEKMVAESANIIIEFYISIVNDAENEVISEIEEDTYWLAKRFGSTVLPKMDELKASILSKSDYEMFKTFVGYDGRINADESWEETKKKREDKIQEFVKEINTNNFAEWEQKMLVVIKNYPISDPGTFQYFNSFLFELAKQNSKCALLLIENEDFKPFLVHIMAGLWLSKSHNKARQVMITWIKQGINLSAIAGIFGYTETVDRVLLNKLFLKAKSTNDENVLNNLLSSITVNYSKNKDLKKLFVNIIKYLTKLKNYQWINRVWYKGDTILKDFSEKDFDVILENLLLLQTIEYHAEEILMPVAEQYPSKVIDFFGKRIAKKVKLKPSLEERYDAIPYNFHRINKPLSEHEKIVLPMILLWYTKGDTNSKWLYAWEASHFLEEIYPDFGTTLEAELVDMINSDKKCSLDVVLSLLGKYQGQDFLWGIVKAIIKKYCGSKRYERIKSNLFGYLSQTGVVSGEYGFVEALKGKRENLQKFKNDPDELVEAFIINYEDFLIKSIDYEQKRADEDLELRKRQISV